MKDFQAIEDNGGGVHLAVFDETGKIVYLHSGYEYGYLGQIADDIRELKTDTNLNDWDGNSENPQEEFDRLTGYDFGWEIVADQEGMHLEKWGAAAQREMVPLVQVEIQDDTNGAAALSCLGFDAELTYGKGNYDICNYVEPEWDCLPEFVQRHIHSECRKFAEAQNGKLEDEK